MNDLGSYVMALLATIFALIGIILAAFAEDGGMYLFGLSLAAFGILFDFFLLKRHFDAADAGA